MKSEPIPILENTALPGQLWLPEGECRLALQLVHGMTEHGGRYGELARRLNAEHMALAVFDLPGHGKNPGDPHCASLGKEGWDRTLDQMDRVNAELRRRFPGVPIAMMGFSLGSFLLRDYLKQGRDRPAAAVILGAGDQPGWMLGLLKALVQGQIRRVGFDRGSNLVHSLSFGAYNRQFAPNRTQADWLCGDDQELDAYLRDPLCREDISAGLFWQLLDGMQRTGADLYENWNRDMPVLLLSGGEDPVGGRGRGVRSLRKKMEAGGMKHVTLELIPGARHDLLHEAESGAARQAMDVILSFLSESYT